MTLSNEKSNWDAIGRLKSWLALNPEIPRFRRGANKAAICRQAGIARSTADANAEIRALLAALDLDVLAAQHTTPMHVPRLRSTVPEVSNVPSAGRYQSTPADRDSLALEHLLNTGRVVR